MTNFGAGPPGYGGGQGDPFAGPGRPAPTGFPPPPGNFAPPSQPPLVPAPARRVSPVATGWSIASVLIGVVAVALAVAPFYTSVPAWVGFIGAAIAIGAVVPGILALVR